jgi:hypothetical protein
MKNKLKLNELQIQSFVTETNADKIKGGAGVATIYPECYLPASLDPRNSCVLLTNITC